MSAELTRTSELPDALPIVRGGSWRVAIALSLAAAVVRLILAAVIPLAPDETYYWEWSRHLATGYFDHPPLIALFIRAGVVLFGATPFGVRVVSVLAGLGVVLVALLLARRLGGDDAALRAAVIAACLPLASAGLILATPDAPLLFATAVALFALDRALREPVRSRTALAWWAIAGLFLGASFASKYTSVLLPVSVLLAFLTNRTLRARFATPGPYLALGVAVVVFLPVLVWNAGHGWISFTFQFQHGFGARRGSAIEHELSYIGGQLALASPVLFVVLAAAAIRVLRRPASPERYLLAVVAVTPFLFFLFTALRKSVEPNWPAIAYIPAIALAAVVCNRPPWTRWLRVGCALGGIMVAAIYIHAVHPILPFPPGQDPMGRTYGWDALAASVDTARSEIQPSAGVTTWVAGNRYQDASELAFHLPEHPVVFSLNIRSRANQYELWPDFAHTARAGDNLLLVLEPDGRAGRPPVIDVLVPYFGRVRPGAVVALGRGGKIHTRRRIWVLERWRGAWPEGAPRF